MTRFESYLARQRARWGGKFNSSELARKFVPYYNSQKRIRVRFSTGEVLSGTVGVTTGWKPAFMLVLTSRSLGSSWLLGKKDRVVPITTPIKRY